MPDETGAPGAPDVYGLLRWGFFVTDDRAWSVVRSPLWRDALLAAAAERGLDSLTEAIHELHQAASGYPDRDAWEAAYRALFDGRVACPPYETDYTCTHVFMQAQQLADISGFYSAFGFAPTAEFADRIDHIALECEFVYLLGPAGSGGAGEEAQKIRADAIVTFLRDHLGRFTAAFAERLAAAKGAPFFTTLGHVTDAFVRHDVERLALSPAPLPERGRLLPQEPDAPECGGCAGPGADSVVPMPGH